jgi:hypothetical protein
MFGYNGSEINGDIILDDIDDLTIEKISSYTDKEKKKQKSKIGYIGTHDELYDKLKEKLGDWLSEPMDPV